MLRDSPVFARDADVAHESEVARALGLAWNCELRWFGPMCPIDFYALRDGQVAGVLEVKARRIASTDYADVFLSVRKWLALQMAAAGLGCPALFVVRFADEVLKYARLCDIDARRVVMSGRAEQRTCMDIEPMILVPVASMKDVAMKEPA